ncbi:unnamed protein product [Lathyrus oleraceus]|uniref:F-box associated beta-propeller type 1 domain-containing protein n=1 Tax=Pisum sativum TaxID=3888 RepID=A0A9D4WJW3_PEA|nr:putative F-box protein At3g16210 [Pisum sativum]KAI5402160.1 hypothetical protein KIW84_066568 [Pisum sativum]
MDSAAVSDGAPMDKGNTSSDSKVSRNYINDDLAFYVLSKLGIKSLKRFGCVRKSWSILFDNSHFMTMFRNHFISHHGSDYDHTFLLIKHLELPVTPDYRYHDEVHFLENRLKLKLPPPFEEDDGDLSIVGRTSVNGIFCIGQEEVRKKKARYVLWNPATEEFVVIPPSPEESLSENPNMDVSHDFHGFGYDQVGNDFKVLQYVSFERFDRRSRQLRLCEIYSLKTNSWRIADMDFSQWFFDNAFTAKEVYMDGACHWLVFCGNTESCLVSFDFSDEVFFTTAIDGILNYYKYLVVLNGSIAIISHRDDCLIYDISILGQLCVKESWIKLLSFSAIPSIDGSLCPIGIGKMGYVFFRKEDDELIRIDVNTQKIEEIGVKGDQSCCRIGIYKKSFFRLEDIRN